MILIVDTTSNTRKTRQLNYSQGFIFLHILYIANILQVSEVIPETRRTFMTASVPVAAKFNIHPPATGLPPGTTLEQYALQRLTELRTNFGFFDPIVS
jgi:hypothetical protein